MSRRALARRLRGRGGFSLSELLVCTIILLLSTTVILETMSLAASQLRQRTGDSEAELLCDLLAQAVQNRLTCAVDCTTDDENRVVSFHTTADGRRNEQCAFDRGRHDGEIALVYGGWESFDLIPSKSYAGSDGRTLCAALDVYWTEQRFSAELAVSDEPGGEALASRSFIVYPVVKQG